MSERKAKEIMLGDEIGDIAIMANGALIEIRADSSLEVHTKGCVAAYTNSDVDVYTDGAVHAHPAVDGGTRAAANADSRPGDKMADGTIFAGISPDTKTPMYTTPADAPLTYTFKRAQQYAAKLDAHSRHDWRVPTMNELKVLFNNRAAIGGFVEAGPYPAGRYWSSSQNRLSNMWAQAFIGWAQRFGDGDQFLSLKGHDFSLRCVR